LHHRPALETDAMAVPARDGRARTHAPTLHTGTQDRRGLAAAAKEGRLAEAV